MDITYFYNHQLNCSELYEAETNCYTLDFNQYEVLMLEYVGNSTIKGCYADSLDTEEVFYIDLRLPFRYILNHECLKDRTVFEMMIIFQVINEIARKEGISLCE